jgi:hypothetical protein
MIPQRNLSLLANRLQREHGGRRIPEAVLERDYALAWLLAGLDATVLKDLLIFKGGTALKRCYFGDYRFSEDLDFTLSRPVDFPEIRRGLDEVFGKVTTDSGINFAFESQEQAGHTNSYTFYLGYQGPLPIPNSVKVDITIEEVIVLPLEQRPVLRAYDEFEDLPNNRTLTVMRGVGLPSTSTTRMFDGFRSRWMVAFWCACCTPSQTRMNNCSRSRMLNFFASQ